MLTFAGRFWTSYFASLAAVVVLATSCQPAQAGGCTAKDKWTGPDKIQHLGMGAAGGFLFAAQSGSYRDGLLAGAAVGVGKELLDLAGGGTCSLQDAVVTAIGGAIGAGAGVGLSVMIDRNAAGQRVTTVTIHKEF